MTLKVIGAGFGRTGTASLYTALNQLGMPCYHMFEVLHNPQNKSHLDFWLRVTRSPPGTQQNWDEVFSRYTAAVDNPARVVWRELLAAYPQAKVVLTLHPKGANTWYDSAVDTIYFTENTWQFAVLRLLTPFGRKFGTVSRDLIFGRGHAGSMRSRETAVAYYQQYIEEVKAGVPPGQLLIFSADQGWEPLCKFLELPVPATPFPNINDRAEFQKIKDGVQKGAYTMLGLAGAVVAVLGFAAWKLLG